MAIIITVIFLLAVMFGAAYVFLLMPRVTDRADMDLLSTDYASRGLWSAHYPENSLPAFSLAVSGGYGIKLEARMSSDGVPMVFCDEALGRMCGIEKKVCDMTAFELTSVRLMNTAYGIPTLKQVLELVDGRVPLIIEIKDSVQVKTLCRKIAQMLDVYHGAFAVEAFDPRVLAWFKRYRPRFARGQIVTSVRESDGVSKIQAFMYSNMLYNVISRPDFIAINGRLVRSLNFRVCVILFKCRGFVWTVTKPQQYKKIRRLGLFAIFEGFVPKI